MDTDTDAGAAPSGTVRAVVGLDDITHWLMLSQNIGHILISSANHWHWTACGTYTPNGEIVTARPARKCRACLKVMPTLKRTQPNDAAVAHQPPQAAGSEVGSK